METNTIKNYVDITERFQFFSKSFAFIDVYDESGYFADYIFVKNKIHVKFSNKDFKDPNSDYRIIFCKIKRKDAKTFLKCMEELKNKMLLCGYTDYEEKCKEVYERAFSRIKS